MYEPGTILTLKNPRGSEDEPFAYDRVEVVGQSPISHEIQGEEWVGSNAQGVIIKPAGSAFGSNLDEPYGKLRALYDVEYIPPNEVVAEPVKVIRSTSGSAGPTPEEQFAEVAEEPAGEEGPHRRRRTKHSPLDGPDTERIARQEAVRAGIVSPLDAPTGDDQVGGDGQPQGSGDPAQEDDGVR